MSKPEDISQEAWDAAYAATEETTIDLGAYAFKDVQRVVARAIEAAKAEEREACAQILDDRAQDFNRQRDPGMANSCRSHARAIRKRGEP